MEIDLYVNLIKTYCGNLFECEYFLKADKGHKNCAASGQRLIFCAGSSQCYPTDIYISIKKDLCQQFFVHTSKVIAVTQKKENISRIRHRVSIIAAGW